MELSSEAASSSSSMKDTISKINLTIKEPVISSTLASSTLSPRIINRNSKLSSPSSTISVTQPGMIITPRNFAISSSPNIDFSSNTKPLGLFINAVIF